jgi:uncharacterized DUF497 family protein
MDRVVILFCVYNGFRLLVVHTVEEENGEEKVRIISARNAAPRERAFYDSHG